VAEQTEALSPSARRGGSSAGLLIQHALVPDGSHKLGHKPCGQGAAQIALQSTNLSSFKCCADPSCGGSYTNSACRAGKERRRQASPVSCVVILLAQNERTDGELPHTPMCWQRTTLPRTQARATHFDVAGLVHGAVQDFTRMVFLPSIPNFTCCT